jgi:mannose-6-phosphate isomerase-like protein (cupin superfamily)
MRKKIFYANVEKETLSNNNYRKVVFTGKSQQFVYMSLKPLDTIHMEVHPDHDQFIRIEKGTGIAIVDRIKYKLVDGIGIIIPAGSAHKIINSSNSVDLKLYSIYSPPEHPPNRVDKTNPDKSNIDTTMTNKDSKLKEKYLKYKEKYLKLKNQIKN